MHSQAETPDKAQLFERDSVMVNEPDFRPSVGSVFNEEKDILNSTNKRMITYFSVFALAEYFLLYIFQRYFYLHKSYIYHPIRPEPRPILDFEISKYFLYRTLSITLIFMNQKGGMDHIKLIMQEFRENQSFLIFVALKILLSICTILLAQYHPVATIQLVLHSKLVYKLATKIMKRYQLRNAELALVAAYVLFLLLVYSFGPIYLPFSIVTMVLGGFVFYASEELITTHINLQEWEVLRYVSLAFVSLLFFAKEILSSEESLFGFEWSEIFIILLIFGIDYVRVFVIKRIHVFVRENTARIYFPLMIVFVGGAAVALDLIFWNNFLNFGEFFGQVVFLGVLVSFHLNDIKRLFMILPRDSGDEISEDLLIQK